MEKRRIGGRRSGAKRPAIGRRTGPGELMFMLPNEVLRNKLVQGSVGASRTLRVCPGGSRLSTVPMISLFKLPRYI